MPSVSDKQAVAMRIAAAGKGKLGIPRAVAREFVREDRKARITPGLRAARMGATKRPR